MLSSRFWLMLVCAASGLPCGALHAAPPTGFVLVEADSVTVDHAWARASAGAASTGAAYLRVVGGGQADQIVGASTPVAAMAEVHQSAMDNGVMKMRAMPNVAIPAGQAVTFAPGGTHIMLMGLKQPLVAGQSFPLTLTFAHAAPVTVDVKVQALGRDNAADAHAAMHVK
jgi:copper(I)-binding protein